MKETIIEHECENLKMYVSADPIEVKEIQVEHPSHYNQGDIECIEALRSALGPEGYKGFCAGNIIKYDWRYNGKDGIKDIKKVKAYADYLIEELELEEEENNG